MAVSLLLLLLFPLATPVSAIVVPRPNPNRRPSPYTNPIPSYYPPKKYTPTRPHGYTGPPFSPPKNHYSPLNRNNPPPNPVGPPKNHYGPPNRNNPPPNPVGPPPKTTHHDIPPIPDAPPSNPVNPTPNHNPPPNPDNPPPNPHNPPPNPGNPPPNPEVPPSNPDNPPPNSYPPPYPAVPPPNPDNPPSKPYPPPYPIAPPPNRYAPPSPYVCVNPIVRSAHTIIRKSATHYLNGRVELGALVLDISIGSGMSRRILRGVLDITSELIWVQCGHCRTCPRLTPRGTRTFLPDASPSFSGVGCGTQICERVMADDCNAKGRSACKYVEVLYGDAQYTSGFLATETFTFGATTATGIVFGCSGNITVLGLTGGASGFLGFSRGPLSLVSQFNISGFSYFISHKDSSKSFFSFWADPACAVPVHQQPIKHSRYTPLLQATAKQNPYLYYVNLTGVKVDGQLLTAVPAGTFDIRAADGSGGVYLSTILPVTYLEEVAYIVLRQELVARIQSQGVAPVSVDDDPLCYMTRSYESIKVPRLALVFDGTDATMDLYAKNYFLRVDGEQTCLTILPSTGGSVLGSLLQAGRTITYNAIHGGGGWLSFD